MLGVEIEFFDLTVLTSKLPKPLLAIQRTGGPLMNGNQTIIQIQFIMCVRVDECSKFMICLCQENEQKY